jgi:pyroglutamyl-peptidase
MQKILLTAYEPFGENVTNSSWEVAKLLREQEFEQVNLSVVLLPVSFNRVAAVLQEAITSHCPDVVLMLGQSGTKDKLKLERVALNMMDSKNGDNDGYRPTEETINSNGPAAYITKAPVKSLLDHLKTFGVNSKISNSAGLYVCNRTYYEALRLCEENGTMQALFVHLPPVPCLGEEGCLSVEEMSRAVAELISKFGAKPSTIS